VAVSRHEEPKATKTPEGLTGHLKYESFVRQFAPAQADVWRRLRGQDHLLDLERAALDLPCPTCGAHLCETFTREEAVAVKAALADDTFGARVTRIARWFVN